MKTKKWFVCPSCSGERLDKNRTRCEHCKGLGKSVEVSEEVFSTFEVARMCNCTLHTVVNWIKKGWLPAYRTAGGHRRIQKNNLKTFLEEYKIPVDTSAVSL